MTPAPASPGVSLDEVVALVGGRLVGAGPAVSGISSLEDASASDLAYVDGERFADAARASRAAAFLVGREIAELERPQIVVTNPRHAFARVVERFFTSPRHPRGIADQISRGADVEIGPDASIWPFVTLGNGVRIGARVTLYPGVFVGDGASIGDDSVLHPRVTVHDGSVIGRRVIVHSGTVIGSDGFGYVQDEGRHHKLPQLGTVVVEDDVELGANVTVDRAAFGRTVIGHGTKVDNLVQIAHNVTIGPHSIIVAQVGIAGSTRLGSHVMIGGQAGLADHLDIADGVMIAAQAGVIRSIGERSIVSGTPAQPHETSLRSHALILRLPELRQQLRDLASRVAALEAGPPKKPRKAPG